MADIVRNLKWRLDLEGDLVEGLGKVTAEAERFAAAGAKAVGTFPAGLKATAAAAKEADTALEGTGLEAKAVERYLKSIENASGSPLVLERNAKMAAAALTVMKENAAAAGREIPAAFEGRVSTAIQGVTKYVGAMNAELEKTGGLPATKLDKVITALEGVAKSGKDAWSELEKLGAEGKAAAEALRAMEKSSNSPRELARNAGVASFAVETLTSRLKASGPAGEAAMKTVASSMKNAEGAINSAANRAARMKDAMGDLAMKANMAGDGMATLRGSAGSLDTMLDRMRETGTGATKAIGTLGVGVSVAATAIMGAVAAGKQLAQTIDEWDAKRAKTDKATADAAVRVLNLDAANRAVTRGLIEQGRTTDDTIRRYVEMTLKMGKLTEQGRAYIENMAKMKAPPAWKVIEEQANAMAITLESAYKRSEEEGNRWALANAAGLKAIVAEYDKAGKEVPAILVTAVAAAEKWATANEKAAVAARGLGTAAAEAAPGIAALTAALGGIGKVGTAESIDAVAGALARIKDSGADVGDAVTGNIDALMKLRTAAEGNYEALAKFRTEIMDQIPAYQATAIATQQYAGTLEGITAATAAYEAQRRAANEADIEASIRMREFEANAQKMARGIDTIGEAWVRATGQAAGFTVEVRRATKTVEEADPAFTAFVESLAGVSDQYERMIPYVGKLIADLEAGRISTDEFGKAIDQMRVAFMQIQGVSGQMFGDIESLFNRLRELTNDFTHGDNPRNKR